MPDWDLIIAAGPSLTRADCDLLRGRFRRTVAVNCAVFWAPWADVAYGADGVYWCHYGPKIWPWYRGKCVSITYGQRGVQRWHPKGWGSNGGNGGHQSMQWDVDQGGTNLAIIGFDHQHTPDPETKAPRSHFHGDHPRNEKVKLGNACRTANWIKCMNRTAIDLKRRKVRVVNITRQTALECFERMPPEEFVARELR